LSLPVALGYIKLTAVTCIALRLCLTLLRVLSQYVISSDIHTHTPLGLLGNEEGGVCWRNGVCVRSCQLAEGQDRHYWEGTLYMKEVCSGRKRKNLSGGGT
jgi:hypothetical protein